MERTEKIGLGIATAGHVLLFGLLSAGFLSTPNPLKLNSPPMEVSLVDEIDFKSAAPQISTQPPPPSQAPEIGPTQDAAPAPEPAPEPEAVPAPAPPKPAPAKKDVPKARPKPPAPQKAEPKAKASPEKPKATAKPAPQKAQAKPKAKTDRPRGSLLGKDFLKGIESEAPSRSPAAAPPAAAIGARQKSALDAEIRRQLKPYWKAPTGADAEQLRTFVDVQLSRDGSIQGTPQIFDTTGVTASNRAQMKLHQELAIKAIRLAAPFKLPADLYDGWKFLRISFDKRLSQ